MRLFIAAELPTSLTEALAENSAALRACVRGRYVGTDSLHITLAFLGNVPTSQVAIACDALDEACAGVAPIPVELGELGSFGKRSKATLWQGISDEGALQRLAHRVREALDERNMDFDRKKFVAHVTLMRAADLTDGTIPALQRTSGTVSTCTLFCSDLSGSRPRYDPLYSVELK